MMSFMSGVPWLWILAALLIVVGIVFVISWAVSASESSDDEAGRMLRTRFARGEIDPEEFAKATAALGPPAARWPLRRGLLVAALALLIGAVLAVWVALAVAGGMGGMMSGMMGMMGPGRTAPPGTSVTMAGARFTPANISIKSGETVRWFNDDAMPHTVTAADRAWDSGNLAPGGSFDRRFDSPGSYPYVCVYHSWMTATVVVSSP